MKQEVSFYEQEKEREKNIESRSGAPKKGIRVKSIFKMVFGILSMAVTLSFLFWVDHVASEEEKTEITFTPVERGDHSETYDLLDVIRAQQEPEYFVPLSDSYTNDYHLASGKIPTPLSLPKTGSIFADTEIDRIAPFTIDTRGEKNFYVKMKDHDTGEEAFCVFVRGGETAEVDVPLGVYDLYYATGEDWYGTDLLFWNDTSYYKAEEIFEFYDDGEYVNGWTVELYLQNNGNMETSPIDPDEF